MKVLLIIWNDPAWHPSFIFTAQIYAEAGHTVRILGCEPTAEFALPGAVDYGPGVRVEKRPRSVGGWRGRLDFARFCWRALTLARRFQPDVIIGFDINGFVAACAAMLRSTRARLIYHNFDLVPKEGLSAYMRALKGVELSGARRAARVILSSPGRAEVLQRDAHLEREPVIVMNCQRLGAPREPTGELHGLLRAQNLAFERLVVRMGLIGPGNAVEALIRSVAGWQGSWGLVLAGAAFPEFLQEMRDLVTALGLEKQVIFLPSVSYSLWYDCLSAADLGIALYVPENLSNQTMAGAGNKLNLYLSAGVPSIVPDLPDFVSFAREYGASEVAEASDPGAIAAAVNRVLSDPGKQATYRQNARRAFETRFNFETQYAPIFDYINRLESKNLESNELAPAGGPARR